LTIALTQGNQEAGRQLFTRSRQVSEQIGIVKIIKASGNLEVTPSIATQVIGEGRFETAGCLMIGAIA
jgi:hypothetical protein